MIDPLHAYVFRDPSFAPSGDTVVCIVDAATVSRFMDKEEIERAFSGYASYKQWPFREFVGVWGRRNTKRLRRFLRDRGAEIVLHRARPGRLRLTLWATNKLRERIRTIDAVTTTDR